MRPAMPPPKAQFMMVVFCMLIQRIRIRNYRSWKDVELYPGEAILVADG